MRVFQNYIFILSFFNLALASRKSSPDIFNDGLLPSQYSVVTGFFKQDDDHTEAEEFNVIKEPNFGLKHGTSWSQILDFIDTHNEENFHKGEAYKLMFLARHGEGFHNIAPQNYSHIDWRCFWQVRDGDGEVNWYDAELTHNGVEQATLLSSAWSANLQDSKDPVPLPKSYYVSPLRRTCQTFHYTWASVTEYFTESNAEVFAPVVKELSRETYGIGTESKRHQKSYIHGRWPSFKFEEGFSEEDLRWEKDYHESKEHRNYRATLLLNDIFSNDASTVISLTSHSGLISSLLKVVDHRKFPLGTGQMIPVLIKASRPDSFKKPKLTEPWTSFNEQCKDYDTLNENQLVLKLSSPL